MPAAVESLPRYSTHKRRVNDLMHESLQPYVPSEQIAFFCECLRVSCFETVWLTPDEYEKARTNERWYLRAPGH
jgi:hypothetical protein